MAKNKEETKQEEKVLEPETLKTKETKQKKVIKKSEDTKPKSKTTTKKKIDTKQATKASDKKETKTTATIGTKKKTSSNEENKEVAKQTAKTSKEGKVKETKKMVSNKKSKTTATKNSSKESILAIKKEKATKKDVEEKETIKQNHLDEEEQEELQVQPKEEVIQIEEIKKAIEKKKVLPKEKREKIYGSLFRNIAVAGVIILYFIFLNLGKLNIKPDVYVTDLKVFSMCILGTAIAIIENAYKKDSGELALYGIETIILALSTVGLIYVELMLSSKYVFIVTAMSYLFAIYYVIKSIIIYIRQRKKYFVDDMKEIIKEEE